MMGGSEGGGRGKYRGEYSLRLEERGVGVGGHQQGRAEALPSRHLWVGNLSPHVTQSQLSEQFLRFGDLENIAFHPGRSYAFVNFKKEEDSIFAKRALQGYMVAGAPLRIEFQKADKLSTLPPDDEHNRDERLFTERGESFLQREIRVKSFSSEKSYIDKSKGNKSADPSEVLWIGFPSFLNVDEMILARAFSPFGEIEKITAFPGRSYAFVRYGSVVAACRAKEALNGKLFNNPRVSICFAKSDQGPAEQGRNLSNDTMPPNLKLNTPGLGGRPADSVRRDRSFESSFGELLMPSPKFVSNVEKIPGDASFVGFGRNSSLGTGAGSGPNAGSSFEHMRYRGLSSERRISEDHFEHHRSSPAVERDALQHDFHVERPRRGPPFEDSWDMDDTFPLAKKIRVDSFPERELPEYPFSDLEKEKQFAGLPMFPDLPVRQIYNKSSEPVPLGYKGIPDHSDNLFHPHVKNFDSWRNSDSIDAGSDMLRTKPIYWQKNTPESHQSSLDKEWKWEGTIAKGGTPVCRARCFPVGKVLDVMLPEFLDCTARTGLDMLAKHFYQAASSWIVFFVPETDADIVYYNEFMHYLGEKQRAAVAKLGERTTLFLVPPSDFSEKVLKVPGKVSISGVILRFQQPSSNLGFLPRPLLEVTDSNLPPLMRRANDEISFHDSLSYHSRPKPISPDLHSSYQDQSYPPPSSEHFTSTTAFPAIRKPLGSPTSLWSLPSLGKAPDSHGQSSRGQIQQQDPIMPPNWSPHLGVPYSSFGNFSSTAPGEPIGEEYPLTKPIVTQGMASSSLYTPGTSGIVPLAVSKIPLPLETKPPVSSSKPGPPLQPEQLAQLANFLGQQKQFGKVPALSLVEDHKQPVFSQKPMVPDLSSATSDSLVPQLSQSQQLQQHTQTLSAAPQARNPEQEAVQQLQTSAREENEADPQKRLQATLQLAAALLQQIQQQSKGDQ